MLCLHISVYLIFDQFFDPSASILEDIAEAPLHHGRLRRLVAVDSAGHHFHQPNDQAVRAARWQQLHRLVYLIGLLGVLHYLWLVKTDISEPLLYAGLLAHYYAGLPSCGGTFTPPR
jgi:sulfoxide reductase heme-binding subunit YedZ